MSEQTELHFCQSCNTQTQHILVLVKKPSAFKEAKNRKQESLIYGFLKAWFLGPFIASVDGLSRHLICEKCGTRITDDELV